MFFQSKKPHYEHLRKKWTARHKDATENLFDKHFRQVALGSLGGLMLLNTSGLALPEPKLLSSGAVHITGASQKNHLLAAELLGVLPEETRNLSREEEEKVGQILYRNTGIYVRAEILGKRLNRTYGVIGGEQHLYRYPGDNLHAHMRSVSDWVMYGGAGIAPGLGAWGYFAPSKAEFSREDEEQERYYLAVQTFLSAGFAERVAEYRDFYKLRKMLVVNPKNGQAVVAVIGDAGPAEWTGKHLGGSPEVMQALGLAGGPRKGPVLYFFVDELSYSAPLGPVKIEELLKS